jgi:hypothetical protein
MNTAARLTKFGSLKAQVDPKELPAWMLDRAQAARWDMPDPGNYEAQAALYTRLSWVYSAVTIVGQACALQSLNVKKLFREKTKDIDNHPFELLLRKPNPLQSRYEFLRDTVSYSAINGNTYWWLNRDDEGAQPSEIWLLPSWRVQPKPDGKLYLEGYEFDAGTGRTIMLPPWQVVHFKTFNPLSEFIGLSRLRHPPTSPARSGRRSFTAKTTPDCLEFWRFATKSRTKSPGPGCRKTFATQPRPGILSCCGAWATGWTGYRRRLRRRTCSRSSSAR